MNFKRKFSIAAETLAAICMVAILLVACSGGSSSGATLTNFAADGLGEVLQFTVNTANMTYSYAVIDSPISGVSSGQNGTGALSSVNPVGTYAVLASNDNYILGGKVFPIANGVMVGHVALYSTSSVNIPVFSISNPVTTLLNVNGVYNYQGFSCNATSTPNAASAVLPSICSSQLGTMSIAGFSSTSTIYNASYTDCHGGDLADPTGNPCSTTSTGTIETPTITPGVFQLKDSNNNPIGWFFAFTAPNGQIVGVIDHSYTCTPTPCSTSEYGFTVLSPHTPVAFGGSSGSYMVETNENQEQWVAISTTITTDVNQITHYNTLYTSSAQSGVQGGTLTPNWPWNGLSSYYIPASAAIGFPTAISGVAMVTGTGAYTHTSANDTKLFAVGVRYGP